MPDALTDADLARWEHWAAEPATPAPEDAAVIIRHLIAEVRRLRALATERCERDHECVADCEPPVPAFGPCALRSR